VPIIRSRRLRATNLSMDALPTNRSLPPSCGHGTYQHKAITSRSRQLLTMGTWLPETCWVTSRREIKNTKVTSSWFFLCSVNIFICWLAIVSYWVLRYVEPVTSAVHRRRLLNIANKMICRSRWSKAWVCGRMLARITCSNPGEDMNVCLIWMLCVAK
jgi:hypothetical protein